MDSGCRFRDRTGSRLTNEVTIVSGFSTFSAKRSGCSKIIRHHSFSRISLMLHLALYVPVTRPGDKSKDTATHQRG